VLFEKINIAYECNFRKVYSANLPVSAYIDAARNPGALYLNEPSGKSNFFYHAVRREAEDKVR